MKIKCWDKRKEKKARFKKSIARARKRGQLIYGGFVRLPDEFFSILDERLEAEKAIWDEQRILNSVLEEIRQFYEEKTDGTEG